MTEPQLIPPPPSYPPAPPADRVRTRLPDWRKGETADLDPETPEPAPDEPLPPPPESADAPDDEDTQPTDLRTRVRKARDWLPERPQEAPLRDALAETELPIWQQRRIRRVAYYGTAAGTGWWLGLGPWLLDGIQTIGQQESIGAGLSMGCGFIFIGLIAAHYVPGWIGRIPVATAVLALALYAPASL